MLSRRRWIVGLGILAVGCCAAMPFQRQAREGRGDAQEFSYPNAQSRLQLSLAAVGSTEAIPASRGIEDHHRIESLRLSLPAPATRPQNPVQQVPAIEDHYPPGIHRQGQEKQVATGPPPANGGTRDQYHQIQDGDTLRVLAEHYLGDANLAAQIYDANRSILASPDLLPLGQRLRIPGRR